MASNGNARGVHNFRNFFCENSEVSRYSNNIAKISRKNSPISRNKRKFCAQLCDCFAGNVVAARTFCGGGAGYFVDGCTGRGAL